jgi:hypothetical protein
VGAGQRQQLGRDLLDGLAVVLGKYQDLSHVGQPSASASGPSGAQHAPGESVLR